jgi:hypothetical protein
MKRNLTIHQIIFGMLEEQSPEAARRWHTMSPIVQVEDDNQAIQAANQFWRIQLGSLDVSTVDERQCLVDTIGTDAWLYDFAGYVMPVILKNNLPA